MSARQSFDVCDRDQGHRAAKQLYENFIKPQVKVGGRGRLSWEPIDPDARHQQRKLFHGPLLKDFAEQVWLLDPVSDQRVRYAPAAWKIHLKDLFCPLTQNGAGGWVKSTEALSDLQFSLFITQCQAYGAMDWNIVFTEQDGAE